MDFLKNSLAAIHLAARHPFGLDFEIKKGKIFIVAGSAINFLGYNDYLERAIGVARVALGLIAVIFSDSKQDKALAAGHVFRGVMEMMGSYEGVLLVLDILVTVGRATHKFFNSQKKDIVPAGAALLA